MARAFAGCVVALLMLTGSALGAMDHHRLAAHTQDTRRKAERERPRAAHA